MPKKQKGGKRFGSGTYGIVFGEPRIPCIDEEYTDVSGVIKKNMYTEVSKLFNDSKSAELEYGNTNLFLEDLNKDELKVADETMVLPLKKCEFDACVFNNPTYKESDWHENVSIPMNKTMVVYKKAKNDLYSEIISIDSIDGFKKSLYKFKNILRGIQLLVKKGFVHRDIKLTNCMVDENDNYVIIDLGDIRRIKDTDIKKGQSIVHPYFVWPSIIISLLEKGEFYLSNYIRYINEDRRRLGEFIKRLDSSIYIWYNFLDKVDSNPLFKTHIEEKTGKPYNISIRERVYIYILQKCLMDTPRNVEYFEKMKEVLKTRKGIINDLLATFRRVTERAEPSSNRLIRIKLMEQFEDKCNNFDDKFTKINSIIDVHSFGVMLIELLSQIVHRVTEEDVALFMEMFNLVIACVVNDIVREEKVDMIYKEYERILEKYIASKTDSVEEMASASASESLPTSTPKTGKKRKHKKVKRKTYRKGKRHTRKSKTHKKKNS